MDYKKSIVFIGLLVLMGLVNTGLAKPSTSTISNDYAGDDDYAYYPDEDESKTDAERTNTKENASNSTPAYFETSEISKIVNIGDTVVLDCDAKNFGSNNIIIWYNQTIPIAQSNVRLSTDDRITIAGRSLHIAKFRAEDEAVYRCRLMPEETELKINVILSNEGRPQASTHHRFVNTVIGDDSDLHCLYNSTVEAHVTWRKDGKDVIAADPAKYAVHNEHKHSNSHFRNTLVVKNVQASDLGEYVCEVASSLGKAHTKVELILTPEAPKYLSMEMAEGAVVNHWSVRSHQPLTEVELNYRKSGSQTWITDKPIHQEKSNEHSSIWKIAHKMSLANGVWHIQVRAKNAAGWSEFSDIIESTGIAQSKTEKQTSGAGSTNFLASLLCLSVALLSVYQ